jgi:hypothetical protein
MELMEARARNTASRARGIRQSERLLMARRFRPAARGSRRRAQLRSAAHEAVPVRRPVLSLILRREPASLRGG